jgi:hypothetical protein
VLERPNTQPSGSAQSAAGHRFGTRQLRELVAARGDAGLWLADDEGGGEVLLRLYPGLPTLEEWHTLELAARQLAYVVDPRLIPIEEIALDVWPRLSFARSGAEPLAQRIAREPMAPEAAVAMCAVVAGALAALERSGVPPVDVSPADVVLIGSRAGLLADVGLPGGRLAHTCVDLDHVAPERAAAIAECEQGAHAARPGGAAPTAESMTYALASIVAAAIRGPRPVGEGPDGDGSAPAAFAQIEPVLRRGLAHSPSERYATPAALVEALGDAIGVHLSHTGAHAPRERRAWSHRAAPARRQTRSARSRPAPARRRTRPARHRAAPVRRRTTAARRRAAVAAAAATVLLAAVIGTVAGSATTAADPPAPVTLAGAGLSIEAPQGWLRGEAGDGPSALGPPALAAHPPGTSTATALEVTRASAPLLAQLADAAPRAVRLGDHDAWRYRDVAVDAGSVADVYVLEDGDGPIVAACLGPSDAPASVRMGCSAALTTLRLDAGRTAALGGDAAARRGLTHVVEDLDRARASGRRALATAATGREQAAAADRLAAAYAHAGVGARETGTVGAPGDLPRLVDELQETGRAYAALATAARATRRTAWAQARERVVTHEGALAKDLAALSTASTQP